jgi:protein O-GlcNAc transferase
MTITEKIIAAHSNQDSVKPGDFVYAEVDIALDPFPYNGTTTTCEALWMGVPVIVLKGKTHRGRVSASIVDGIGLCELAAPDLEQYVSIAAALAADPERLQSLRAAMRERMQASALLDGSGFTAKLEAAYSSVFSRSQNNVTCALGD